MCKTFKKLIFLEHDAQDGMETISNGTTDDSSNQGEAYDFEFGPSLRDKDRLLPLARVASVMKKALPVGVMVNKKHTTVICYFLMITVVIDSMYGYII